MSPLPGLVTSIDSTTIRGLRSYLACPRLPYAAPSGLAAVVFFLIWVLIVTTLIRFGMLAATVAIFSANTLSIAGSLPGGFGELTTAPILISLAVGITLLVGGFILSLGNRSRLPSNYPARS